MCYKSPGARCETHAIRQQEAADKAVRDSYQEFRKIDNEISKKIRSDFNFEDTAEGKRLKQKASKAWVKYKAKEEKRKSKDIDPDATKGGIKRLKAELKSFLENKSGSTDDSIHTDYLRKKLSKAEAKYKLAMDAYDKENMTVDGRSPSNYGTPEGLKILKTREKKIVDSINNASSEELKQKRIEKLDAIKAQIGHAIATQEAVKLGYIRESAAAVVENRNNLLRARKELSEERQFRIPLQTGKDKHSPKNKELVKNWRSSKGETLNQLHALELESKSALYWGKMSPSEYKKSIEWSAKHAAEVAQGYNKGAGSWAGD